MKIPAAILNLSAVALMVTALPSAAQANSLSAADAQQLRKLDIMLMVSSLRCRFGPDNFQKDYQKFSSKHLRTLNSASQRMRADLTRKYGARGAKKALDRVSVGMANRFGNGHPSLDCAQLKAKTQELTRLQDRRLLLEASKELLHDSPRDRLALAAGQ